MQAIEVLPIHVRRVWVRELKASDYCVSNGGRRQDNDADRAQGAARDKSADLPAKAVRVLADEAVYRLAMRLRGPVELDRLDVSIDAFCQALLSSEPQDAGRIIAQERRDGVSLDTLYLHTIAGASRQLGEMWERDEIGFLKMTVAVGRIFTIIRQLRQEVPIAHPVPENPRRAFLASVPGETHTLGVTMAAAMLRDKGWEIDLLTGLDHDALVEACLAHDHLIFGFSAGREDAVVALIRLILAVRVERPSATIVVSGHVTDEVPGLSEMIAADAVIGEGDDIVAEMERVMVQAYSPTA